MERKILDYYPPVLRRVRDFKALAAGYQYMAEKGWSQAEGLYDEQDFLTMGIKGISHWEKIYRIKPSDNAKIEDRRFAVQSRRAEQPPFTWLRLQQMMDQLCPNDYRMSRDLEQQKLYVILGLYSRYQVEPVRLLLDRVVPMNMEIELELTHMRWSDYTGITWSDLRNKTWREILDGAYGSHMPATLDAAILDDSILS